jgi:hypothetical protein
MEAWPTMFDSFVEWVKGSSEFQDLLSCWEFYYELKCRYKSDHLNFINFF